MAGTYLGAVAGPVFSLLNASDGGGGGGSGGSTALEFSYDCQVGNLSSGSWNWDQTLIANGVRNTHQIVVSSMKGASSSVLELNLGSPRSHADREGIKTVVYTGSALKSIAVGTSSSVFLYDLSSNRVRRECKLANKSALKCLAVNPKDTHLAVGCNYGTVQIFNARSGVTGFPIVSKKLGDIVAIR